MWAGVQRAVYIVNEVEGAVHEDTVGLATRRKVATSSQGSAKLGPEDYAGAYVARGGSPEHSDMPWAGLRYLLEVGVRSVATWVWVGAVGRDVWQRCPVCINGYAKRDAVLAQVHGPDRVRRQAAG